MSLAAVIAGDARWHIEQAHVLDGLRQIPDDCVSCVVTSIPYWGLRSYGTEPQVWGGLPDPVCRTEGHDFQLAARTLLRSGGPGKQYTNVGSNLVQSVDGLCSRCGAWSGELGAEPTIPLYVAHIVEIFREVRRVLHPTGTCWLNVGDSYAGSGKGPSDSLNMGNPHAHAAAAQNGNPSLNSFRGNGHSRNNGSAPAPDGLKPKDLCLIPERLAIALQDDGWWVRSPIAWCKTSAMPESVTDRPTSAWEYIWLLAKSNRYYYDAFAVRTADKRTDHARSVLNGQPSLEPSGGIRQPHHGLRTAEGRDGNGANLRNFWIIGPEPFAESHFATFPSEIPRRAIAAGSSARGICPVCGAPWKRTTARVDQGWDGSRYGARAVSATGGAITGGTARSTLGSSNGRLTGKTETLGWAPTCPHYDDRYRALPQARSARKRRQRQLSGDWWRRARARPGAPDWPTMPSLVLDPFMGSGTTALAATALGRRAIGLELSPQYVRMARRRVQNAVDFDAPLAIRDAPDLGPLFAEPPAGEHL